jgi:hypothetical protein
MRVMMIVAGIAIVLAGAFIDAVAWGVVPWWIYGAANLAILAGILRRCTLRRLIVAIVVLALTLRISFLALSSLGHRLYTIRPGMTVEEARRRMVGFKEGSGLTSPYTGAEFVPDGALIFRDPSASEGDMTWGVVVIRNGRVASVYLDPD